MRRRHNIKIIDAIVYEREDNIHAVQTFCGAENGVSLLYNPDDNEYYLFGRKLERGDLISRDTAGKLHLGKKVEHL